MSAEKTLFTRKKAVITVLACAVLLLAAVFAGAHRSAYRLSTAEGREKFLASLGWEIDPASEEFHSVVIPDELNGVMESYNEMLKAQGYDLSRHLGEKCDQYSYILTNYPNAEGTVYVTLYIQGNSIIAGDIHSTSVSGFMHGLRMGNAG